LSRNAALAEARKLERVVLIELVGVEPLVRVLLLALVRPARRPGR
jgi:hypothetical protein